MNNNLDHQKVLITGAEGMLGSAFVKVLKEDYPHTMVRACSRAQMDVTDRRSVSAHADFAPDWIIHCAADVNADRCERNPEECEKVQVGGTLNVLELAEQSNSKIFYPQSFLVYGANQAIVDEQTTPEPASVYARCKLQAEHILLESGSDALVVRMAGFFGGLEKDKNFVGKFTRHISKLIKAGIREYPVGNRVWQPTYTVDLARNSLALMERQMSGVWCMSCEGHASFLELATECVELLDIQSKIRIVAADEGEIAKSDVAKRPESLVMDNQRLIDNGLYLQRTWKDSLAEYLNNKWFAELFDSP